MHFRMTFAFALLCLVPLVGMSARADEGQSTNTAAQAEPRQKPLKDCTPFNGRYGYYGNPWCNEHEQRAWDLWSDRQTSVYR